MLVDRADPKNAIALQIGVQYLLDHQKSRRLEVDRHFAILNTAEFPWCSQPFSGLTPSRITKEEALQFLVATKRTIAQCQVVHQGRYKYFEFEDL